MKFRNTTSAAGSETSEATTEPGNTPAGESLFLVSSYVTGSFFAVCLQCFNTVDRVTGRSSSLSKVFPSFQLVIHLHLVTRKCTGKLRLAASHRYCDDVTWVSSHPHPAACQPTFGWCPLEMCTGRAARGSGRARHRNFY